MTGKTHQVIGLASSLFVFSQLADPAYNPATLAAVAVGAHFAALLPDLDQPGATFWRQMPFGRVFGEIVDPFIAHRNFSHSLLGAATIALLIHYLLHYVPPYWGINTGILFFCSLTAYLSHIAADLVTVQGVPLFFPWRTMVGLPPAPFQGLRILTGRWFENLVVFPLANAALVGVVWYHWPVFSAVLFR
jgi:inner membrane protein